MRVVLDTNILLDVVLRREPFYSDARLLMMFGYLGEFELWMGSSQVTDFIYVASYGGKASEVEKVKNLMAYLRKVVHIYATNEDDFDAVSESTWTDLEDAFVFQTAQNIKAGAIISRDKTGFSKSPIKVFDCTEFFAYLKEKRGVSYEEVCI